VRDARMRAGITEGYREGWGDEVRRERHLSG
jgi:hypothetical protein